MGRTFSGRRSLKQHIHDIHGNGQNDNLSRTPPRGDRGRSSGRGGGELIRGRSDGHGGRHQNDNSRAVGTGGRVREYLLRGGSPDRGTGRRRPQCSSSLK